MTDDPTEEVPGFEADVNELPPENDGPEDTLEDKPSDDQKAAGMVDAQAEAAEERTEGGYQ